MKKIVLLWVVFVSCVVTCNCYAINNPNEQTESKTIFSFKKEIGLTNEQENQIKSLLFDTQQSLNPGKSKINTLSAELTEMIKNKNDIGMIRKKLVEISKVQIDLACLDIENGRKIESVLSAEQLKKWNSIKEVEVAKMKK